MSVPYSHTMKTMTGMGLFDRSLGLGEYVVREVSHDEEQREQRRDRQQDAGFHRALRGVMVHLLVKQYGWTAQLFFGMAARDHAIPGAARSRPLPTRITVRSTIG